ncbi:beta-glucosidase [Mangrovicella endophytica]|uniref:beta-glucosidase n=1 Tax=Mangrovicella endophytica TaxID=2066697 RepID=UPI0018E46FB1|nr:beta-glucosidase [Mangrovicella endophytica]
MGTMFSSFFLAGFECSTHRRADGSRLDLLASSQHDIHADKDYRRLRALGIAAARDGVRWHRIEVSPHHYDWSSAEPMVEAARQAGMQVVWDLCHYGWPDDIDIWSPEFVERFAAFAAAAARHIARGSSTPLWFCPVNEISYWAWAGAEVGLINPATHGRGAELKRQLVRAAVAAMKAIGAEHPDARFVFAEPLIHVDGGAGSLEERAAAEAYRLSQFEVFDMLSGRMAPELGGCPSLLDVVGVNFYPDNQWYLHGSTIPLGHHAYRPLRLMLREVHERYGRPVAILETGAEGTARAAWLHYVVGEVAAAIEDGVPLAGVCLYPILDYAGWQNGRLCPVGLLSIADERGERVLDRAFAEELASQQRRIERLLGEAGRGGPAAQLIPAAAAPQQ